jgi:hypothetical protein
MLPQFGIRVTYIDVGRERDCDCVGSSPYDSVPDPWTKTVRVEGTVTDPGVFTTVEIIASHVVVPRVSGILALICPLPYTEQNCSPYD